MFHEIHGFSRGLYREHIIVNQMLRTISNRLKGRRKVAKSKINSADVNMLFDAVEYSRKIVELHVSFYNGRFQYFSGSGFIVDYQRGDVEYSAAVDPNDPYVIAKTPAEATKYLREFVSSCQNHNPCFSHPALQRLTSEAPMSIENLDIHLTVFRGDSSMKYYLSLHEHSDRYRGANVDFTTEKTPSSSML